MNLLELHILQSFPVTCLNRDDVGAPKTAVFGGAPRARVSSQCWKRAIRKLAKERLDKTRGSQPNSFGGQRSKLWYERIKQSMLDAGMTDAKATEQSSLLLELLASKVEKPQDGASPETEVAVFFTPLEMASMAKAIAAGKSSLKKKKKKVAVAGTPLKQIIAAAQCRDRADIAVFGRMVANDHTLMLEGAGMFSHALSTHRVSNEVDFFSAIDELKAEESKGAGHIGTLEFNSACYYRYVGLNVDLLHDEDHLGYLAEADLKRVVDTFLRASVESVPEARHNSMFGHNPPGFVLGLARKGQPLSLANAFEAPVTSGKGYLDKSREALEAHWSSLKTTYGIDAIELRLPESSLDKFVEGMVGHV